ncbi:MAG TPA: hypothetical protein VFW87_15690, partial [Pirellulales bacterium]|nr:hypothetical protein [Pirellulales bacterium]
TATLSLKAYTRAEGQKFHGPQATHCSRAGPLLISTHVATFGSPVDARGNTATLSLKVYTRAEGRKFHGLRATNAFVMALYLFLRTPRRFVRRLMRAETLPLEAAQPALASNPCELRPLKPRQPALFEGAARLMLGDGAVA